MESGAAMMSMLRDIQGTVIHLFVMFHAIFTNFGTSPTGSKRKIIQQTVPKVFHFHWICVFSI